MAFLEFKNVRIAGISAGVPKSVLPAISTTLKYETASFIKTTGVKERRYSNDFTTSDLCLAAAKQLIKDLRWEKNEIEALIFVTQTPDYILPATSCILQNKLGLTKDCYCVDISLGCSGWVYGMCTISGLMSNGYIRKALLLAGDARRQAYEEPDQLFGFAGTVTALEYVEGVKGFKFYMGTDGSGYDVIIKPVGGTRNQITTKDLELTECEDGRKRHRLQTLMKGMDVFAFGITTAPQSVKLLTEKFAINWDSIYFFIFHQANQMMNEQIRKKLKLEPERVPYSIHDFGNTSSASIPLTIVTQIADKIKDKETNFIACGFGVGLSWGTIFFTTNNPVVSQLVEL